VNKTKSKLCADNKQENTI